MKENTEAWTETPTQRVFTDSNNRMGLGDTKDFLVWLLLYRCNESWPPSLRSHSGFAERSKDIDTVWKWAISFLQST